MLLPEVSELGSGILWAKKEDWCGRKKVFKIHPHRTETFSLTSFERELKWVQLSHAVIECCAVLYPCTT